MGNLPLSSIIQGAVGTAQAIWGLIERRRAKDTLYKARLAIDQAPKYMRPGEYGEIEKMWGERMRGEAPGFSLAQERLGAQTAGAVQQAAAGADSPAAYAQAMQAIQQRSLDAERGFYMQNLQYKQWAQQGLIGSKLASAQEGKREWYYNEMLPNERKLNLLAGQYNLQSTQGAAAIQGGLSTLAQSAGGMTGGGIQWPSK